MSKVLSFKTGDLADAASRAARIAPNKGAAFDRAAGILLETDEDGDLIVRSTDVEVSYRESLTPLTPPLDDVSWRVPAALIDGVLSNMDPASEVTLAEEGTSLRLVAGKKKATLRKLDASLFPKWLDFDNTDMAQVDDLALRLKQAAWACDSQSIPFTGIHITGDNLIATDRYKLVRVPCKVPVEKAITVPLSLIAPLISENMSMQVRAEKRRLLLMPNERTKISTVIFDAKYPEQAKLKAVMRDDFTIEAKIKRAALLDALTSMAVLVKTERYPTTKFTFNKDGSLHLYMDVKDAGEMEDTLDVECDSDFEAFFTPSFVINALNATTAEIVTMRLGSDPTRTALIEDDNDYRAWLMPRKL